VRRAQLLLQRHHGGGGGAMPRDDGGGHFNQPAVLHGPKKPEWGCSKCGFAYNWASRLSCKECGNCAAAYTKDRAQARQSESRARWSEQRDGRATGRNAGGRTSGGTGGSVANGQLKALQAEVEQLRRKLATQPCSSQEATDDDGEGQSSPSIAALVAAYEAVRSLGEKDPLTKMAKERLDEARTKRDLGKAAPVRVREAERLATKRKKDHESAQRTVQDAKNDLAAAELVAAKCAKDLEEAEEALRSARACALSEAGGDLAAAALQTLESKLQLQGDKECQEALEVLRKKAALATAPDVPPHGPPDGNSQPGDGSGDGGGTDDDVQMDFDRLDEGDRKAFVDAATKLGPQSSEGLELDEAGQKRAWAAFLAMQEACKGSRKKARSGPYTS